MALEISDVYRHCSDKINAPLNGQIKYLIGTLVASYNDVLEKAEDIENARAWYMRAVDAYDSYRLRGDPVTRHLGALQHTYVYCEERVRDAMNQLDDSDD